jgi:hypothetical protein
MMGRRLVLVSSRLSVDCSRLHNVLDIDLSQDSTVLSRCENECFASIDLFELMCHIAGLDVDLR